MIKVTEQPTKKMPGETSLFVQFEYNPAIVEVFKTFPQRQFHKDIKAWEVPITLLSQLLDTLSLYDEIQFTWMPDKKVKKDKVFELQEYKTKPFPYQLDAIQYGLNHNKFLLLDEPGLGKTLEIIYTAQELKARENIEHCLIICGVNTLKTNWKSEIQKHSNLSCRILGERVNKKGKTVIGSVKDRLEDLKHPIKEFYVISNIETFRNLDIINALNRGPNNFEMIVVDEIHTCFSKGTLIETDVGPTCIENITQNSKVLTYNFMLKKFEYQQILNVFKIPSSENLLKLTILDDNGNEHIIKCTPDHKIYTQNRGFIEAKFLTSDDILKIN